jgi:ribose 5-phosphate isomerase B
MSIVANKVRGIRCGHCHDVFSAKMTRLHNDANVMALGERVVGPGLMIEIVDAFLNTEFSGDIRHARRVGKIVALEEKNFK